MRNGQGGSTTRRKRKQLAGQQHRRARRVDAVLTSPGCLDRQTLGPTRGSLEQLAELLHEIAPALTVGAESLQNRSKVIRDRPSLFESQLYYCKKLMKEALGYNSKAVPPSEAAVVEFKEFEI